MSSPLVPSVEDSALFGQSNKDDDRLLEVALHHANLIQARKDAEDRILESLELLLDFPNSSPASENDAIALSSHLRLFRPCDFDDLVVERNTIDKCGFPLCSARNRKQAAKTRYRIVRGRRDGSSISGIVDATELSSWCSEACQLKARHLKAQLSDEPSWIRSGQDQIDLRVPLRDVEMEVVQAMEDLRLNKGDAKSKQSALALERGDANDRSSQHGKLVNIEEKVLPSEPAISEADFRPQGAFDEIEGHRVRAA